MMNLHWKFWLVGLAAPSVVLTAPSLVPAVSAERHSATTSVTVLEPDRYRHYIALFQRQEQEATGKPGSDSWPWMLAQIPWFESSDKNFDEIYYSHSSPTEQASSPAGNCQVARVYRGDPP